MEQLRFSISEVLSLIGIVQCVYIIVYIIFRTKKLHNVKLALTYFLVITVAFIFDFSNAYIGHYFLYYDIARWFLWTYMAQLSILLVLQITDIVLFKKRLYTFFLLALPILSLFITIIGFYISKGSIFCNGEGVCNDFLEFLNFASVLQGLLSLFLIWQEKGSLIKLLQQKSGRERYALVVSLIIVYVFLVEISLLSIGINGFSEHKTEMRTLLGLLFLYLTSTSFFRVYPFSLVVEEGRSKDNALSEDEIKAIERIKGLLELEKVYHEPNYSRTDLAREVGVSDGTISRIINVYFNKSFPQLLSEYRVADAKHLLLDTDASIKIISDEVGFNSLASFNRSFRTIVGQTPSEYRKNTIK